MEKKAAKVLLAYYLFLGLSSLLFSILHIHTHYLNYSGYKIELNPMWIPTIVGGIIALRLTLPIRSFKFFVIMYSFLWVVRFTMLYAGYKLGAVYIFHHTYRFDIIVSNYYKTVSRLDTHLPFVLYWFINYLYTIATRTDEEKKEATTS
jgi:hypothetical protein